MMGRLFRVAVLATSAIAQTASSFEDGWKEAALLQQAGKLEAASAKYQALLQARPDFVPALSNLGTVYSRLGRFDDAAGQFRRALALEPSHFGIRLNLALALYQQAMMLEAVPELEILRNAQPSNAQVLQLLADVYLRTGEEKKVIALLESLEASADRATVYLLGTALVRDGQVTRGQRLIDQLFRDNSAESLMLLGAAQMAAQENKKALATLEEAIAKNPNLPGLHSLYGQAKLTDGDPDGGKDAFLKELERNPADYDANLQLGALYRVEKDYVKATRYLDSAMRMRPHSVALKYQRANLELAAGQTAKAAEMLEEVIRDAPKFVEGHITLATAYYRLKRRAEGDRERAIVNELNAELQAREAKP